MTLFEKFMWFKEHYILKWVKCHTLYKLSFTESVFCYTELYTKWACQQPKSLSFMTLRKVCSHPHYSKYFLHEVQGLEANILKYYYCRNSISIIWVWYLLINIIELKLIYMVTCVIYFLIYWPNSQLSGCTVTGRIIYQ